MLNSERLPFLECRQLSPELVRPLSDFFAVLRANGDDRRFHPHPFTDEEAALRCTYGGKDLYYVLVECGSVLGYGMLRGWDSGYTVPSLGIAIHPEVRGTGMGRLLMDFLHVAAKRRGAPQIRLKVYPDNHRAIKVYQQLGYRFYGNEASQLVGWKDLA